MIKRAPFLKPCPFCGGGIIKDGPIRDGRTVYCVSCTGSVYAFSPDAYAKAIDKWNARPHPQPEDPPCLWKGDDGTYETSCGQAFTIIDGTPADNDMRFCTYCGKPIEEKKDD